jgi:hypothetical protein
LILRAVLSAAAPQNGWVKSNRDYVGRFCPTCVLRPLSALHISTLETQWSIR